MLNYLYENWKSSKLQFYVNKASRNAMSYAVIVIVWKIYTLVFNNEVPLAVVLTGSMEPAYFRGDIIHLNNNRRDFVIGDQVCFRVNSSDVIPVVHRIIKVIHTKKGVYVRTKGDNNAEDDRFLYNKNQKHMSSERIIARVIGNFPYLGHLSIFMKQPIIMKVFTAVVLISLFYE